MINHLTATDMDGSREERFEHARNEEFARLADSWSVIQQAA